MRKRIYEVIELSREGDRLSTAYDYLMMTVITLSLIPLVFKRTTLPLLVLDKVTVSIFIADYLLRLATADYKLGKTGAAAFLRYPFTFMALIDLLSILPSLTLLNNGFKVLRLLRMARAFRAFRVLRAMRYSKSLRIIADVLRNSRDSLLAVGTLAVGYIFISALVVFNAEPDSFKTFFEAMYWATVSLTTVGYGDIYPVTTIGRVVAMISSITGVAIVALPSGIITAGYMKELAAQQQEERRQRRKAEQEMPAVPGPLSYNPRAPRL